MFLCSFFLLYSNLLFHASGFICVARCILLGFEGGGFDSMVALVPVNYELDDLPSISA